MALHNPSIANVRAEWQRAVERFDKIASNHKGGSETERLRTTLEQDKQRLVAWGTALDFNNELPIARAATTDTAHAPVVAALLDLQDRFADDALKNSYGCRSTAKSGLRKAFAGLRSPTSPQSGSTRDAAAKRAATWEIVDKHKFRTLLDETARLVAAIYDAWTPESNRASTQALASDPVLAAASDADMDALMAKMRKVELYTSKHLEGVLMLRLNGPQTYSTHVDMTTLWVEEVTQERGTAWENEANGLTTSAHPAFELYRRRYFFKKDSWGTRADDRVLFDPESFPEYENINPGTVTPDGFAIECWEYEAHFGKPRTREHVVGTGPMPSIEGPALLRRLDELQRGARRLGWDKQQEDADLQEFGVGYGSTYYVDPTKDPIHRILDLYRVLNRTDIFADFSATSTVASVWGGSGEGAIGIWNLLWQIILSKELAERLGQKEGMTSNDFTLQVFSSLTIATLWLENISVRLMPQKLPADLKSPSAQETQQIEQYVKQADAANSQKQFGQAVELYTQAMLLDLRNLENRRLRSLALEHEGRLPQARDDACIVVQIDPKNASAWSRVGELETKSGNVVLAREAFDCATQLDPGSTVYKKQLEAAKDSEASEYEAVRQTTVFAQKDRLRKVLLDQEYDNTGKTTQLYSLVHERQVEGILRFARQMQWPHLHEAREWLEDAYPMLQNGGTLGLDVHDWLYGMMLPGKYMSFKIMATLILSTPSLVAAKFGRAPQFDCGLALPQCSYWRVRSVLGRVLGCLPGVQSMCGWVGPCPSVEFDGAVETLPRHVMLKARRVTPITAAPITSTDDGMMAMRAQHDPHEAIRRTVDEPVDSYMEDITNDSAWSIPAPPSPRNPTINLLTVRLKRISPVTAEAGSNETNPSGEYRASVVFTVHGTTVPLVLYTNPVFVTVPLCLPGREGAHKAHKREMPKFESNVVDAEQLVGGGVTLKDTLDDDAILVINATGGPMVEAMARAWCAQEGRDAVIRRKGGPCYTCAVRAAGKGALGTGTLIWV